MPHAACRSTVASDPEPGGATGPSLAVNLSVRQLADPRGFYFARPRPADEIPEVLRAAAHGELLA